MKYIIEEIRIFLFGKEKNTAKTIVNWFCILFLLAALIEYHIDHNGNMSGLFKKETWTKKIQKDYHKDKLVYIVPLGDINEKYLDVTSKVIENKFGVKTIITGKINYTNDMFYDNKTLNPNIIFDNTNFGYKTIILTDNKIFDGDYGSCSGCCLDEKILIDINCYSFDETLIHEYGHSLGLLHCSNKNCVMTTYRIHQDITKRGTNFCENCKKEINYDTNI